MISLMIDQSETTPSRRGRRKRSRNGKRTGLRCWSTCLAAKLESHLQRMKGGAFGLLSGFLGGASQAFL